MDGRDLRKVCLIRGHFFRELGGKERGGLGLQREFNLKVGREGKWSNFIESFPPYNRWCWGWVDIWDIVGGRDWSSNVLDGDINVNIRFRRTFGVT